ncbi:hypothetical protein AnigIFM60653_000568 [Aspergillus niger]|nr:hypothetical protein AnigIFM60653_000568 [Aspergillus niger]
MPQSSAMQVDLNRLATDAWWFIEEKVPRWTSVALFNSPTLATTYMAARARLMVTLRRPQCFWWPGPSVAVVSYSTTLASPPWKESMVLIKTRLYPAEGSSRCN